MNYLTEERAVFLGYLDKLRYVEYVCSTLNKQISDLSRESSKLGKQTAIYQPSKDQIELLPAIGKIIFGIFLGSLYAFLGFEIFGTGDSLALTEDDPFEKFLINIGIGVLINIFVIGIEFLLKLLFIAPVVISIAVICSGLFEIFIRPIKNQKEYTERMKNYHQKVTQDKKRLDTEQQKKEKLDTTLADAQQELEKFEQVRRNLYNLNKIPKPYRGLHEICYVYEYLATSQETFSDALNHLKLDEIHRDVKLIARQQQQIRGELFEMRQDIDRHKDDNDHKHNSLLRSMKNVDNNLLDVKDVQKMQAETNQALVQLANTHLWYDFLK